MINLMKYVKAVHTKMDLTHRTTTNPAAITSWLLIFRTFTFRCGLESPHMTLALNSIFLFWNWFREMTEYCIIPICERVHTPTGELHTLLSFFNSPMMTSQSLFNHFKWSQLWVNQKITGLMYAFTIASMNV